DALAELEAVVPVDDVPPPVPAVALGAPPPPPPPPAPAPPPAPQSASAGMQVGSQAPSGPQRAPAQSGSTGAAQESTQRPSAPQCCSAQSGSTRTPTLHASSHMPSARHPSLPSKRSMFGWMKLAMAGASVRWFTPSIAQAASPVDVVPATRSTP